MGKSPRKIEVNSSEEKLLQDLENYKKQALELGAARVEIVKTEQIPVDDRVVLKCRVPRCFGYGTNAHCPPHAMTPPELRELLTQYSWGVFVSVDIPPETIVRDKETIDDRVKVYMDLFELVNKIESLAFYDGHYLSFGLGAGSCRHSLCAKEDTCRALEGKRCKFSLKARPSMEAVGIDVYRMMAEAGWDVYPIGSDAQAEDIPQGSLAGLIVIA